MTPSAHRIHIFLIESSGLFAPTLEVGRLMSYRVAVSVELDWTLTPHALFVPESDVF